MSLMDYTVPKIKIDVNENLSFYVKGLTTSNIMQLANKYSKLLSFIFDGIKFDQDNRDLFTQLLEKAPGLCYMTMAICIDEPVTVAKIEELPAVVHLECLSAIIELTFPAKIEDYTEELKKLATTATKLFDQMKKIK